MIGDFIKRQKQIEFMNLAYKFIEKPLEVIIEGAIEEEIEKERIDSGDKGKISEWGFEGREIVKDIADAKKKIEEHSLKPHVLIESDPAIGYPHDIVNEVRLEDEWAGDRGDKVSVVDRMIVERSFNNGIMYAAIDSTHIGIHFECPKCKGRIEISDEHSYISGRQEINRIRFKCVNCKLSWVDTYKLELLKREI